MHLRLLSWPLAFSALVLFLVPGGVQAQEGERIRLESLSWEWQQDLERSLSEEVSGSRVGPMVMAGLAAGAIGMAVGWEAGRMLTEYEWKAFLAAAAMESWAIPFGVHHANGFRGDRFWAEMASYGIGLVGLVYVGSRGTDTAVWTGAIVFPLAQIATSVWILSGGTD